MGFRRYFCSGGREDSLFKKITPARTQLTVRKSTWPSILLNTSSRSSIWTFSVSVAVRSFWIGATLMSSGGAAMSNTRWHGPDLKEKRGCNAETTTGRGTRIYSASSNAGTYLRTRALPGMTVSSSRVSGDPDAMGLGHDNRPRKKGSTPLAFPTASSFLISAFGCL